MKDLEVHSSAQRLLGLPTLLNLGVVVHQTIDRPQVSTSCWLAALLPLAFARATFADSGRVFEERKVVKVDLKAICGCTYLWMSDIHNTLDTNTKKRNLGEIRVKCAAGECT